MRPAMRISPYPCLWLLPIHTQQPHSGMGCEFSNRRERRYRFSVSPVRACIDMSESKHLAAFGAGGRVVPIEAAVVWADDAGQFLRVVRHRKKSVHPEKDLAKRLKVHVAV